MSKPLTPTELRRDVYRILDEVIASGSPREIVRGSDRVLLVPASGRRFRMQDLPRRNALNCTPDELIETSWEGEWSGEG